MHDKDTDFAPKFDESGITPSEIKKDVETEVERPTNFITGEDLLNRKVENIPCLIDPIMQKTGLACLAGSSDTGKSMILRQLCIAVSLGNTQFLGWKLNTIHQAAIYVSTEDDSTATSFLLNKQAQGIDPARLKNLRFIFDSENLITELDTELTTKPADLVVIDCFSDAFGQDLKDTQKVRTFLNKFTPLAEKHQCLFLFLHHTGKRTENLEPNKNNLLSGQGFEGKMRLVIEFRADPTLPDRRHICIVKGNYLAADHKQESYVLEFDKDTFRFNETKDRTAFETLVKKTDDEGRAKFEQALSLKNQGKKGDEIAKLMGYKHRSAITKLLKRFDESDAQ
jgi:archaellum biogenesis ATPase FlaH